LVRFRGKTLLACIFDETGFWRDESSAMPDVETYRAVMPSLIASNGMLIGISTPYRKLGLLHSKHRDHYAVASDDVLVVQGDSAMFNSTLSAGLIEAHKAADPEAAVAEWDAQFRSDISVFLSEDLIELAIDRSRPPELPPQQGVRHWCYTVCVGHKDSSGALCLRRAQGQRTAVRPAGDHPGVRCTGPRIWLLAGKGRRLQRRLGRVGISGMRCDV
jgi:hypothetical protein